MEHTLVVLELKQINPLNCQLIANFILVHLHERILFENALNLHQLLDLAQLWISWKENLITHPVY